MFKFLVILAFLIRFALMPISAHSDLFFINIFPNLFFTEKVFDITTYVDQHFSTRNFTYYSPLTYYTFVLFQSVYKLFSDSFSTWMSQVYVLELNGFSGQAADFIKSTYNPNIHRDLFLAKLPYLIFDIASILILLKLLKRRIIQKLAVVIWLFNPVNLYATYLMGQFDIIPTFFVLLALYLLRKNTALGVFFLGVSAAYKNFALLFLIPIVFIYGETWIKRLRLLVIGIIPYAIFLIPTLISNFDQAFYQLIPKAYIHYRKPIEGWALYSQTIKYFLLFVSYFSLVALAAFLKVKNKWKFSLSISLLAISLVYVIAPRISFHYLLWSAPLILLWFKKPQQAAVIIIVQAASLASYKLLANHLQFGLLAPLNADYFANMPTLNSIIDNIIPYGIISSTGFFFFLFINLFISWKIFIQIMFKSEISKKH